MSQESRPGVALSVRAYARQGEARVGHLRRRSGEHEVYPVVERPDGIAVVQAALLGPWGSFPPGADES